VLPVSSRAGGGGALRNCRGGVPCTCLYVGAASSGLPLLGELRVCSAPDLIMHMWLGARGELEPAFTAWRRRATENERAAWVGIIMRSAARRLQLWWLRCMVHLRLWYGRHALQPMLEVQWMPCRNSSCRSPCLNAML
jgi:hypothetical protein